MLNIYQKIECLVQTTYTILYTWFDEVNCNTTQPKFSRSVCSQYNLDGGLTDRLEDLDGAPVCLGPASPLSSPPLSSDPLPSLLMHFTRSVFHRNMSHACITKLH